MVLVLQCIGKGFLEPSCVSVYDKPGSLDYKLHITCLVLLLPWVEGDKETTELGKESVIGHF